MEGLHQRFLRRIATGFLTGPAGRLTAFTLDVGVAATLYWGRRLAGEGDTRGERRRRTAFVTGGSGFIGGRLIRRLVGDGWRVRALARSDAAAAKVADAGAEPARGDLDDAESMRAGAEGCGCHLPCGGAPR